MPDFDSTPGAPEGSGVSISGSSTVAAYDIIGGDANTATLGDGAQVGQFAQGSNITQITGYTAAQVTVLLDKIRTEYTSKPFDGRSPYIGLASFQERDADKFFGRETLTAELVTRVMTSAVSNARAVFVAGPSGSGKSSLVRAGLIPALRGIRRDVQLNVLTNAPTNVPTEHWLYETLKPGRAPLDELGRVAAAFAGKLGARDDVKTRGTTDATILHQWADIALGDDANRRAVIVIDQFEEIFTQLNAERENERVAFLNLLTHAVTVENGRVLVIFTLRSDFVSNCASYQNLNALVNQQFIQVGAMTPDELVSAIARPALQVGLRIDPALISQIVNDVRGEPGALPLMQFALQDLFEAEKHKGELTLDGYTARGGLHEALERHADAEFAKLDDAEKQLARTVFSGLIEIGRGREDTKRTALFGELVPAGADATQVQDLVRELADARLITTDEQDGKETVTLAHERLIDAWDWLRKLVDENRDAIALQNEIAQDAQEWETQKRDESYLYRGARLATAQEKLQQNQLVLSGLAQEFVETAIAARERERAEREAARQRELEQERQRADAEERARRAAEQRARILRFAIAGVSVLALVAILASCFAFQQQSVAQQEANQRATAQTNADQRALEAEQSKADAESAADAADTAAREAGRQKNLADVARATAEAEAQIARSRELAALAKSKFETNPDLAMLIAIEANRDTSAITFESEDALREILFQYPLLATLRRNQEGVISEVGSAQFSRDGARIVTASDDGVSQVWDAATGQELVRLRGHTARVNSAQFSRDGTRIVTASEDGTARVWDAASGKEMSVLRGHMGAVVDAQFSPNDKWILTLGCEKANEGGGCTLGTARLWDVAASLATSTGKQLAVMNGKNVFTTAKFSPDGWQNGIQIVTTECESSIPTQPNEIPSCYARAARVWNLIASAGTADVKEMANFYPDDLGVIQTEFVSNRTTNRVMAVTNDSEGKVQIWDAVNGKEISALRGVEYDVTSVEISPDGTKIVTASSAGVENTARVWNIVDGELIDTLAHVYQISSVHFSPDGEKIVTASSGDQTARVWHVADLSNRQDNKKPLVLNAQDYVTSVEFSLDSTQIITTGPNRGVQLWDANGGRELTVLRGHSKTVNTAQFSPDSTKIVTAGCGTSESFSPCKVGTTRLWDAQRGQELAVLSANAQNVLSADFSVDGNKLVTNECEQVEGFGCLASVVRTWGVAGNKSLATLRGQKKLVLTARFSNDAKQVVTVECADSTSSYCLNGTARVWDAETGAQLGIADENTPLSNAVFSPNGVWLVTTGCETVETKSCTRGIARVWDISKLHETGIAREHAILHGHAEWVRDAQFSRDSSRIVTGSRDGTARVWDAASGKELETLRGDDRGAITAQFSQDGTRILTANHGLLDRTVRVWNAANGAPIIVLSGFASGIISAQWSQDGTKIITVNVDRTVDADYFVQMWDATTGARLAILRGLPSGVNSARFSPDGTRIVTASDDGTARVYLVNVKDLIELAKLRVGRELDCGERKTYLGEVNVCPTPAPEPSPTP